MVVQGAFCIKNETETKISLITEQISPLGGASTQIAIKYLSELISEFKSVEIVQNAFKNAKNAIHDLVSAKNGTGSTALEHFNAINGI